VSGSHGDRDNHVRLLLSVRQMRSHEASGRLHRSSPYIVVRFTFNRSTSMLCDGCVDFFTLNRILKSGQAHMLLEDRQGRSQQTATDCKIYSQAQRNPQWPCPVRISRMCDTAHSEKVLAGHTAV
jgi:hypothetical protein